jgi:hypothetical protein
MGKQVDFSAAFHLFPVLNFMDIFSIRATTTQRGEYLDEEPGLDF